MPGCKFDLGTGEPLKNFGQTKKQNEGGRAGKIKVYFWSQDLFLVIVRVILIQKYSVLNG